MPFKRNQTTFLVIPGNAGPGEARIVITSQLPPPLDTYTWFVGPLRYAGGIIFYPQGDDTSFNYLATVDDPLDNNVIVHMGRVWNGAVVETLSPGPQPKVQAWSLFTGTGELFDQLASHVISMAADGDVNISALGIASILSLNAAGQLTLQGTSQTSISATSGPVGITGEEVNLFPTNELQLQGTRAYLTTQLATPRASSDLTLTSGAAGTEVLVPGCTVTLPTITANARYKVKVACDFGCTSAGTATAVGALYINGTIQTGQALLGINGTDDRATVFQTYSGILATAGNYTFALRARKDAASGTMAAFATHTCLTVEILESGG